MMKAPIAYCGLSCVECPAYIATRDGDSEKLISLALEWYGVENDSAYCACEGCKGEGRKNQWCSECGVRACAIEHGVANCAHCESYGCERLKAFLAHVPNAKANLEHIRAAL